MKHPNPLMLVRIAQGDAYGVACEYVKLPEEQAILDQALRFERYGRHPVHRLVPGQYTDDTQMSIAVAEVLLSGAELNRLVFADAFVVAFKRDMRDGYARGFQTFLEGVKHGPDFLARIRADSDKNGAAMRSVPLGVLPNPRRVMEVASLQARLTHDTPHGILSSVEVALMSHFALYEDAPLSDLPAWLKQQLPPGEIAEWNGGPVVGPDVGMKTATAVLTLVSREKSLIDIAEKALRWGGDTDSVLAIAWGIASTRMREPLPGFFDHGLESGVYGRGFLEELGERLMKKFAVEAA